MEETKNSTIKEIDFVNITKRVLAEKKTLGYFILTFAVIGIIYAINQQKTYTSTVTLAPEASGMGMSESISDLANIVGVTLGGNNGSVDAIYPDIYPEVISSSTFLVNLFDVQVKPSKSSNYKSYYNHIIEDQKIPFWSYPGIWIGEFFDKLTTSDEDNQVTGKAVNIHHLTKKQDDVCKSLRKLIGCQLNSGTNIISISVEDVDPVIAATMVDTIQKRLQDYIIQYRTHKARVDLEYAQKINKEAEDDYLEAQRRYIVFAEGHTNSILSSYQTKMSALEDDMELKHNTFGQTSQQVQQARAKVQERTPAFTVIQEACVPLKPSSTPRSFMVLGFIILGCLADAAWVLYLRSFFKKYHR